MYYRDMKKKYVIGIVFAVLMVSLFYLKRENNTRALFSWRSEVISEEADELIEFINDNKFNTLYQEFDLDDVEYSVVVLVDINRQKVIFGNI